MADWANLPHDILCVIALELDLIEDFVYFSVVCHSWNFAFAMVKLKWSRVSKPITPWLLLGEPKNNDGRRKIFSIDRNKCYELSLPETFGARCWGSPYGWILMLHLNKKVELYNPITKARLKLPSVLTISFDPEDDTFEHDDIDDLYYQKMCVRRFIILKMPGIDEFVVMAIHWRHDDLAFARPGDQAWTPIHTSCSGYFHVIDVCFWNEVLLILYQDGTLNYCDIEKTDKCDSYTAKLFISVPCDMLKYAVSGFGELYMVVLDGQLHVVSRMKTSNDGIDGYCPYYTCGFLVHKLDVEKKMWEQVTNLGDFMLFVGNNTSMFANVSKTTNGKRNAIYFTDDEIELWNDETNRFRGHDMGVHDMAIPNFPSKYFNNGIDSLYNIRGYEMPSPKYKKFYEGDDVLCESSSPTWFIPKF